MTSPTLREKKYNLIQSERNAKGRVQKCKIDEKVVILKEISVGSEKEKLFAERAYRIMRKKLPNIVRAHGSTFDNERSVLTFSMKYYEGGNFKDYVTKELGFRHFITIFRDLVKGIYFY